MDQHNVFQSIGALRTAVNPPATSRGGVFSELNNRQEKTKNNQQIPSRKKQDCLLVWLYGLVVRLADIRMRKNTYDGCDNDTCRGRINRKE